jgi:hypothetical protein
MPRKRPRTVAAKKKALRLKEEARRKRLGLGVIGSMIRGKR